MICRQNKWAAIGLVALCVSLPACSGPSYVGENWTETVVAVLGASVQNTQGTGVVAFNNPHPPTQWELWKSAIDPMPEAIASAPPTCQDVTTGVCLGAGLNELNLFYDNCFGATQTNPGLRAGYVRLIFPLPTGAADCANVVANGMTASAPGLVGKTISRLYGNSANGGGQAGFQANFRLAPNNETVSVYTDFPSGWQQNTVVGGITVQFVDANTRLIKVLGLHAVADVYQSMSYDLVGTIDLSQLEQADTDAATHPWDHTLNTVESGDVVFVSGPAIVGGPNGGLAFAGKGTDASIVSSTAVTGGTGDATVVGFGAGATLKAGAAFRVQHNHSKSVGVSIVTTDLVWGDPNCCWPTQGAIHTEFDRFYDGSGTMPWFDEDLTFNGGACGSVSYVTTETNSPNSMLNHCL